MAGVGGIAFGGEVAEEGGELAAAGLVGIVVRLGASSGAAEAEEAGGGLGGEFEFAVGFGAVLGEGGEGAGGFFVDAAAAEFGADAVHAPGAAGVAAGFDKGFGAGAVVEKAGGLEGGEDFLNQGDRPFALEQFAPEFKAGMGAVIQQA